MVTRPEPTRALFARLERLREQQTYLSAAEVAILKELRARGELGTHSARHGTDGGYYAHRRSWGTPPCERCRAAHAQAERLRRIGVAGRRLRAAAEREGEGEGGGVG